MATLQAASTRPFEEAAAALRATATGNGYTLDEAASGSTRLAFKKGMSAMSWGSTLTIDLQANGPAETAAMVSTGETMAITDWGRGKRAATKLLQQAGATVA